ncbi:MAG TPA: crosslink repair DNA glycosylase YcaQ family protein, partial [Anaerolineae bacterium]|nr:crosslink repair DNA glycosylase YcaQ family protein [Anaerolineae bacterium]
RAPQARRLDRQEALAELAGRFFATRGPATVHDLAKWSSLTVADARDGLEAVKAQLEVVVVDGQELWFPPREGPPASPAPGDTPAAWLLSIYDEYIAGFQDRSAIMAAEIGDGLMALGNALSYVIVVDSQIVGSCRRTLQKSAVTVETNLMVPLAEAEQEAVAAAARRYGEFLGLPVALA